MNSTQRFTHIPLIPVLGALGLGFTLGLATGMHIRSNFIDNKPEQVQIVPAPREEIVQIIQTQTQEIKTLEQKAEECQPQECKFDLPKPVYDFITQKANGGIEEEGYTSFYHLERDLRDIPIISLKPGKFTVSLSECLASACDNTIRTELVLSREYFDGTRSVYILDSKSLDGKDLSLETVRNVDGILVYDRAYLDSISVWNQNGYCDVVKSQVMALAQLARSEGVKNE